MLKYFLTITLILFLFHGFSFADYYQWEDEQGTIYVTDYPPPVTSGKKSKVQKYEVESESNTVSTKTIEKTSSESASSSNKDAKYAENEVILYGTSWCPYCKKARDFFNDRNIPFTDYDIEKDKEAAERKNQLDTGSGVPFVIINGRKISGYSPADYERALRKNP
ncbi:MAG: glutaredoxin family protein [Smithella sp.]